MSLPSLMGYFMRQANGTRRKKQHFIGSHRLFSISEALKQKRREDVKVSSLRRVIETMGAGCPFSPFFQIHEMLEKSRFSNRGLGLLVIHAKDMEASAKFYEALGLRLVRHSHPPCGDHYSTVGDEFVFEICQQRQEGEPVFAVTFGFRVSCVDRAVEAALSNGGALKRKPQMTDWGRSATITDPDGHAVLLMEAA